MTAVSVNVPSWNAQERTSPTPFMMMSAGLAKKEAVEIFFDSIPLRQRSAWFLPSGRPLGWKKITSKKQQYDGQEMIRLSNSAKDYWDAYSVSPPVLFFGADN